LAVKVLLCCFVSQIPPEIPRQCVGIPILVAPFTKSSLRCKIEDHWPLSGKVNWSATHTPERESYVEWKDQEFNKTV
jgi:hypothetical protein